MRFIVWIFILYLSFWFSFVSAQENYKKIDTFIENNSFELLKLRQTHYKVEKMLSRLSNNTHPDARELEYVLTYFAHSLDARVQHISWLHITQPKEVKALYYSAYNTSREDKITQIIDIAKDTEVNALVIDIKEIDGLVSFDMPDRYFGDIKPKSNDRIQDISEIIKKLHENNIYVIARIVVFKDSYLANTRPDLAIKWSDNTSKVWTDYKWNAYTDQYSKEVWDYHIALASAAYELGFDEINFDYVRFPTDGYISSTYYPHANELLSADPKWGKMQVMEEFSYYITSKLKEKYPNIILSADVFGLVTNTNLFQIGQNLENFILYFDYVAPMIYPSHYASGYLWHSVPDNAPYEIFYDSMQNAQAKIENLNANIEVSQRESTPLLIQGKYETSQNYKQLEKVSMNKIRPWLQAFHCSWCPGATYYDRAKFRKQIEAIEAFPTTWWYSWNASGRYEKDWY